MKDDKFDLICDTIYDWQGSFKDLAAQFTEEDYKIIFDEGFASDPNWRVDDKLTTYYYERKYWEEFLAMFIRDSLADLVINGETLGFDNLYRLWKETIN